MPDDATTDFAIRSETALRTLFGTVGERAIAKSLPRLDRHCREFIARR